jgi:hypothetical protein
MLTKRHNLAEKYETDFMLMLQTIVASFPSYLDIQGASVVAENEEAGEITWRWNLVKPTQFRLNKQYARVSWGRNLYVKSCYFKTFRGLYIFLPAVYLFYFMFILSLCQVSMILVDACYIPTCWSERSACAALCCWHKHRWPL